MERIVDFIIKKIPYYNDKEVIKSIVSKHIQYGTFDYEEDYNGIVYCLRYNIDGNIADVLDLCVRDKEALGVIKYIIAKNLIKWPVLVYFRFVRSKYKDRERIYKISDVLKKEIKWAQQK